MVKEYSKITVKQGKAMGDIAMLSRKILKLRLLCAKKTRSKSYMKIYNKFLKIFSKNLQNLTICAHDATSVPYIGTATL